MTIELPKDARESLIASIKQYLTEKLDQDIGDLKTSLLLDFILKEIGPVIYNGAIADAQAHLQDIVSELDGTVFEPQSLYPRD